MEKLIADHKKCAIVKVLYLQFLLMPRWMLRLADHTHHMLTLTSVPSVTLCGICLHLQGRRGTLPQRHNAPRPRSLYIEQDTQPVTSWNPTSRRHRRWPRALTIRTSRPRIPPSLVGAERSEIRCDEVDRCKAVCIMTRMQPMNPNRKDPFCRDDNEVV